MAAGGRNHGLAMGPNGYRNAGGFEVELNDHQIHHQIGNNAAARLHHPRMHYEACSQQELEYREKIRLLELQNSTLHSQTKHLKNEMVQIKQSHDEMRQQLHMATINRALPAQQQLANNVDGRLANIERLLTTLCDAHVKDRSQFQAVVNSVSKTEVYCDEFRIRLAKIEETVSARSWYDVDVHEYGVSNGEPETHARAQSPTSPLFSRREDEMLMSRAMGDGNEVRSVDPKDINLARLAQISPGAFSSSRNGNISSELVCNGASASISMDRRPSDSTTSNTESGYCDEREDVFEVGDQGTGPDQYRHEPIYEEVSNDSTTQSHTEETDIRIVASTSTGGSRRSFANSVIVNNDIEVVAELNTSKRSALGMRSSLGGDVLQLQSQTSQVEGHKKSVENRGSISRRPSVFSRAGEPQPRASSSLYMDFDDSDPADGCETNGGNENSVPATISQALDPEISSINDIFEGPGEEISVTDENLTALSGSSALQIKRRRMSDKLNETEKKIRRIAKAPVKQELEPLNLQPQGNSQLTRDSSPPLLEPPPSQFMETLRNIKKERVAHAVDGCRQSEDGNFTWKCICGHQTTTKNGIKLHVKHMGTEEAHWKCPWSDCNGRFVYPFMVKNHLIKDHKDTTVPDKLHGCEKCFSVFYDKSNLKTHRNERGEICKYAKRRRTNNNNGSLNVTPKPNTPPKKIITATIRSPPPLLSPTVPETSKPSIIITL